MDPKLAVELQNLIDEKKQLILRTKKEIKALEEALKVVYGESPVLKMENRPEAEQSEVRTPKKIVIPASAIFPGKKNEATPVPDRDEASILPSHFGDRLKNAMKKGGYTVNDMAGRLGVKGYVVSAYINKKKVPSDIDAVAQKLTTLFGDFGYQDYWKGAMLRFKKVA